MKCIIKMYLNDKIILFKLHKIYLNINHKN